MDSDLSAPPSPSSDTSSPSQSPDARATIEPMDLTDFIGSLNAGAPKSPKATNTKGERKSSVSAGLEVDQKSKDKEWKRLLDRDYDYSKMPRRNISDKTSADRLEVYVHAEDFDCTKSTATSAATSKDAGQQQNPQ